MVGRITIGLVGCLVIMYVVPFPVYGLLAWATGLEPPAEGSPARFALSVLVIKVGVSAGFAYLFYRALGVWRTRWLT